MANVYQRIAQLMPPVPAIDIGGGRGDLARFLCDHGFTVAVWDHSATALELATQGGLQTNLVDLCGENLPEIPQEVGAVLATEVLELLNEIFAWRILARTGARTGFFSVPNNRLGPDEEPQHVRKWTAIGFKRWLADYFDDVRVEVIDGFLLGIVNEIRHDRAHRHATPCPRASLSARKELLRPAQRVARCYEDRPPTDPSGASIGKHPYAATTSKPSSTLTGPATSASATATTLPSARRSTRQPILAATSVTTSAAT